MQFAITLGQLNPRAWEEVAVLADDLGFESLWLPEHLVFPDEIRGQLIPGEEHPPVPPSTRRAEMVWRPPLVWCAGRSA